MKLLIIGAGGHGKVVKEVAAGIADEYGIKKYDRIDFLDDKAECAVGKLSDLEMIAKDYDEVFCGIGNNQVREKLLCRCKELGLKIACIIHPTAYVSPSAVIMPGTVVEPKAIVNAGSLVGFGCIISAGAIVDHDVVVEDFCHVNVGAICGAGSRVAKGSRIPAGEVITGD